MMANFKFSSLTQNHFAIGNGKCRTTEYHDDNRQYRGLGKPVHGPAPRTFIQLRQPAEKRQNCHQPITKYIRRLLKRIDSSTGCLYLVIQKLKNSRKLHIILAIGFLSSLSACQTGSPSEALSIKSKQDATAVMVKIAKAAQTCWFKSKDVAFRKYRLANEVNSPAGRPRILLVPKSDPAALPLLVVQAQQKGDTSSGKFTDVQAYGPILSTSSGSRITSDVKRWTTGDGECK